ncbi:ubiquitin carboxyl-terminal hydrolase 14 [Pyrrhoderma noxium]|uniref:Ubiquitin carboxyl-terminal hydrolase 14 n=1 Tax=Pyrrhoderma noxium TaxID=2282107 RepID=A0A286UV44_9AGAM|nr:ubiquitin carboxyl-terminal hydrolase 14 [Pyrrhoderma noxium]
MAHTCTHISTLEGFSGPKLSQSVHREECTQCFDNQDTEDGVDICLSCFNGGCNDEKRHHAYNHANKTGHTFTFNIKRRPKPTLSKREDSDEPPAKMAKLAIVEEKEEDKFDHTITLKCWQCDPNAGKLLPRFQR